MTATESIRAELLAAGDEVYRDFQCKLMPTVPRESVIGIRMPILRRFARELNGTEGADAFLAELPHKYYDENNLHGILISLMKNYDKAVSALDRFLPYVDNWATCDIIKPAAFNKTPPGLIGDIKRWLASGQVYTVRFGVEMLMNNYLGASFTSECPALVAGVDTREYYVSMMAAWYFATALAKRYDEVIPFLTEHRLDIATHNRTIRKAIESYRITEDQKSFLRTLKRT